MATTSISAFQDTKGKLVGESCISTEQLRRSFNYDLYYQATEHESETIDTCRPLLEAAMDDEWETAEIFLKDHPGSENVPITICKRTALHIAAGAAHSNFILNLVDLMSTDALELKDRYDGNTALHLAVIAGLDEAVKAMVAKHKILTSICNEKGLNPLLNAAIHISVHHRDIIRFLCDEMKDAPTIFQGHSGAQLICSITRAGLYELAYNLIREHPSLATAREDDGSSMLDILAEKGCAQRLASARESALYFKLSHSQQYEFIDNPSRILLDNSSTMSVKKIYFYGGPRSRALRSERLRSSIVLPELVNIIFEEISRMTKKEMCHFFFHSNFLKTAAKTGSIEILKKCISTYPDQLWFPHEGRNIFQIAVENRQVKTFYYLYGHMNADEKILTTRIVDSNGGNILHVAATMAPPLRLRGSLVKQIRTEITWFKKVERRVPSSLGKMKNDQGETPREVFTREHKDLVNRAEEYTLRTAESCLIAAALIATVTFAAIFTVPGGNFSDGSDAGEPIYLGKKSFLAFMVFDALALFSSAWSIQTFLSVYGMTHSQATFESIISAKLKSGRMSLQISVVCVMVAFSTALAIILGNRYEWAPYLIGGVAGWGCISPIRFMLGFGIKPESDYFYY